MKEEQKSEDRLRRELESLRKQIHALREIIYKQKQTEKELRENELRFRTVTESALAGVYIIQEDKFRYVNPSLAQTFGYTPEEIIDKMGPLDLTWPDDREIVNDHIQRRLTGEVDVIHYEFRGLRKDGSAIYCEVLGRTIKYKGRPAIIGTLLDTTERKQAEKQFRESEKKYRILIEQSNDAIFLWYQNKFEVVNKRFLEMVEYSLEELNTPDFNLVSLFSPESKLQIEKRLHQSKMGEKIEPLHEFTMVTKSGKKRNCEASISYIDYKDGKAIQGIIRDITERQRAETEIKMLAQALRSVSECVSITDKEDIILFVNDAFLHTYGYSREELIGQHINMVRSPNNPPEIVRQILPETFKGGWQGEILNQRKNGSEFPVYLSTSVVHDEEGYPIALIGVSVDITESKRLEEQLRQSQKLEAIGRLAGGIAHDFNNLLTVINGYCDLLLKRIRPEDPIHTDITHISKAGERAAALTKQLLAFSRRQVLQPRVINLNAIVVDINKML